MRQMHKIDVDFSVLGAFNPTPEEARCFMAKYLSEAFRSRRLTYKIRVKRVKVASKKLKKEGLEWQYEIG